MTIPDLAAHGPCRAPSDQGQRISPIWQIRYLEASWGSLPLGNHGRACTSLFAYDSMTLWSCKNLWMKETSCMEASSPNAIHCACWVFKHSQTLSSNFRFCMHLNYMIWSGNATYVKHCAENCINIYIYMSEVGKSESVWTALFLVFLHAGSMHEVSIRGYLPKAADPSHQASQRYIQSLRTNKHFEACNMLICPPEI